MWDDLYADNGKQALREAEMLHTAMVRVSVRRPMNRSMFAAGLAAAQQAAETRIKEDFFGVASRYAPVIEQFASWLPEREAAAADENERNVNHELATIRNKVTDNFFNKLKAIELPLTAAALNASCEELMEKYLAAFNEQTIMYSEFESRTLFHQELETQFRGGRSDRMHQNNQAIDAAILRAADAAKLQFQVLFTHQMQLPMTGAKLAEMYSTAAASQIGEFENLVSKYSYVALYSIVHTGLTSTFADTLLRTESENLAAISRLAEEMRNQMLGQYTNTSS